MGVQFVGKVLGCFRGFGIDFCDVWDLNLLLRESAMLGGSIIFFIGCSSGRFNGLYTDTYFYYRFYVTHVSCYMNSCPAAILFPLLV